MQPVRDAFRGGGISGMSFRFRIVDETWGRANDGMEERTIREVELYEVGPVVFPAYEQTSVGVRTRQALSALSDQNVRDEIANILATGVDITSVTDEPTDDPGDHSSGTEAPTAGHASTRTKTQRIARMRFALNP